MLRVSILITITGGYCGKQQIIVGTQKMFASSYN